MSGKEHAQSIFPREIPKPKQVISVTVKKTGYVSEGIVMRRNFMSPSNFYIYLYETTDPAENLRHIYYRSDTKKWTAEFSGRQVEVVIEVA